MVCCCLCFPGGTLVTTKTGIKRMDELLPSEEILTLSRKSGREKWTRFYTWAHKEPERTEKFVQFTANNGKVLQISGDHLLFVEGSKGNRGAVIASKVVTGDKLFHYDKQTGSLNVVSVTEITVQIITGVFAPFTMSGDFLANEFMVACYASVSSFDVAHAAMAPLRAWCRFRQTTKTTMLGKDGVNNYAVKLVKVRELLPSWVQKWI